MTVLDIRGLTTGYGSHISLSDVTVRIDSGEVLGLLGPNGAGKTTLMNAIVGRVPPRKGMVRVGGTDVTRNRRACRALTGYASQDIAVFPTLTVRENLTDWAAIRGVPHHRRRKVVVAALDGMVLDEVQNQEVRFLSGGQKRRVHCAMATLGRPPLLLLDEPTVGVDPATRRAILNHVRELAAEGMAICYSTHYLPEVEALDAHVVLLNRGRVVARGEIKELLGRFGRTIVDLRFRGEGDVAEETRTVAVSGSERLPSVLHQLGADLNRLSGIEIRHPNLDEVFEWLVSASEERSVDAP